MRNRKSARKHAGGGILWFCILLLSGSAFVRGSEAPAGKSPPTASTPSQEIVVALKEIPVWDVTNPRVREAFLRGQFTNTQKDRPQPMVKYPKFTSDSPLYGFVDFPNAVPNARQSRRIYYFALDSSVKGGDYNLLYFDDNRDEDLTNDKLRHVSPESDKLARRSTSVKEIFFEPVQVPFRSAGGGEQPLELLACVRVYQGDQAQVSLIAAHVHTGEFQLDGKSYQAFVGYRYMIGGQLDQPSTALILLPPDDEPATWSGAQQLNATHLLGGRYYRFACTPTGDRLTVQPYAGPLGVFEIGSSDGKTGTPTMRGALRSATTTVAVGAGNADNSTRGPTRSCQLPVGDYRINDLSIRIEGLHALVLNNYHEDGKPMGKTGRSNAYGLAVREDKPFVLRFSRQAQVLFALPARDQRIRLGEELNIKAVLIDPDLDVMFRVLTRGQQQLDPKVTIARANGEIVAEGTMPFG